MSSNDGNFSLVQPRVCICWRRYGVVRRWTYVDVGDLVSLPSTDLESRETFGLRDEIKIAGQLEMKLESLVIIFIKKTREGRGCNQ